MRGRVWVEFDEKGPIKIFRRYYDAVHSSSWDSGGVKEVPRRNATAVIRQRIFERAANRCEDCGKILTSATAHLHEIIPRGKGGEISLENSILLCYDCHINGRHFNRRLRFGENEGYES